MRRRVSTRVPSRPAFLKLGAKVLREHEKGKRIKRRRKKKMGKKKSQLNFSPHVCPFSPGRNVAWGIPTIHWLHHRFLCCPGIFLSQNLSPESISIHFIYYQFHRIYPTNSTTESTLWYKPKISGLSSYTEKFPQNMILIRCHVYYPFTNLPNIILDVTNSCKI